MTTNNYGLSVMGNIRVFRKDKEIQGNNKKKFTVTDVWFNVSEKEENGEWFNLSMNLIFKKDLEKPENNSVINIISARPMITGNGKYRKISLYVEAWQPAEIQAKEDSNKEFGKNSTSEGWTPSDDDLPF